MTPFLEKYQSKIMDNINQLSSYQFAVNHMEISWYHFSPVILFNQVTVYDKSDRMHPIVHIHNLYIGMSLIELIKTRHFMPNRVIVDNAVLNLPKSLFTEWLNGKSDEQTALVYLTRTLEQLSAFREIGFKNLTIQFMEKQQAVEVIHTKVLFNKRSRYFHLQVAFTRESSHFSATLLLLVKPNFHDIRLSSLKGSLTVSALPIAEIREMIHRSLPFTCRGDISHLTLLVGYANQQITYASIDTILHQFMITTPYFKTIHPIEFLSTNMVYQEARPKSNVPHFNRLRLSSKQQPISYFEKIYPSLAINRLTFDEKKEGLRALIYFMPQNQLNAQSSSLPIIAASMQNNIAITLENFVFDTPLLRQYILLSNTHWQKEWNLFSPIFRVAKARIDLLSHENHWTIDKMALDIHHLQTNAVDHFPGCQDVYAKIGYTPLSGKAYVIFHHSIIQMPWLFRKPVEIEDGHATLFWEKNAERWKLAVPSAILQLPEGVVQAGMSLFFGEKIKTRLELMGRVETDVLSQAAIKGYLPIAVIPGDVLVWLDQSLEQVGAAKATLLLRGDMDDFPFDKQEGLFLIQGDVKDAALSFYKGWPEVTTIGAHVLFLDRKMLITGDTGRTENMDIHALRAEIPNMGLSATNLTIDANGSGKISDAIHYIRHSPLGEGMDALDKVNATGDLDLSLGLFVPLSEKETALQAKGTVYLKQAGLTYTDLPLTLSQLNGEVHFLNSRLDSSILNAYLGKKPITLQIEPIPLKKG